MRRLQSVLAVFLILWSISIGDEKNPLESSSLDKGIPSPIFNQPLKVPAAQRLLPKTLNINSKVKINHKQFIDSFSRQAVALDLGHCLRSAMRQSDAALAVAAELEKNGQLRNIRIIDSDKQLPPCADEIISSMDFQSLVPPIEGAGHTIYWRVDW